MIGKEEKDQCTETLAMAEVEEEPCFPRTGMDIAQDSVVDTAARSVSPTSTLDV